MVEKVQDGGRTGAAAAAWAQSGTCLPLPTLYREGLQGGHALTHSRTHWAVGLP